MLSTTLRRILFRFHGVTVGRYSYGACTEPGLLPAGSVVGNYCSTAEGLRVFRRNHPVSHITQHPFFYNKELGLLTEDSIETMAENPLIIGHDVWIGAGVTILPGCSRIGDGAVLGAGSVVTRNVEPFSINGGNPARRLRYRFSAEIREKVVATQWWLLPITELNEVRAALFVPVTLESLDNFIASLDNRRAQRD